MNSIVKGLEGLQVDDTEICLVDGTAGQLSYRGELIDTLVQRPFVDVVSLVVGDETSALADELRIAGALTEQDSALLRNADASGAHPMHVLMGLTPLLSVEFGSRISFERFGDAAAGFRVAAKLPALIAGLLQLRAGKPMIDYPIDELDFNTRFLIQAGATEPSDLLRQAFNVTQILQIEHSSTPARRRTGHRQHARRCSEQPRRRFCRAARTPPRRRRSSGAGDGQRGGRSRLRRGVRRSLPGRRAQDHGHGTPRVQGARSPGKVCQRPRARPVVRHSTGSDVRHVGGHRGAFPRAHAGEGQVVVRQPRVLQRRVYRAAGLPAEFFTATFAMARVFGYLAHFMESRVDNRLIRPAARYTGPLPKAQRPKAQRPKGSKS